MKAQSLPANGIKRSKRALLIGTSICAIIIIAGAMVAAYAIVKDAYADFAELQYSAIALIFVPLNGLPSLFVACAIIKFAFDIGRSDGSGVETVRLLQRLFKILKVAFFVQAIYTFVSINCVAFLENIGPPPLILATWFIVLISLTLGLLFSVLHGMTLKIADQTSSE